MSSAALQPAAAREVVSDLLLPTAEAPNPARRIPFWLALVAYPIMPRTFGPHLAVARFGRALAAHMIGVVVIGILFLLDKLLSYRGDAKPWSRIPDQLAAWIIETAANNRGSAAQSGLAAVLVVAGVPILHMGMLLLAAILMPWCAGGDGAASVWKRSVNNVYWSTLALIPLILLVTMSDHVPLLFGGSERGMAYYEWGPALIFVFAVGCGWLWLRALFVGAREYVGPPDGPAFSPREPRCEDCGYYLIGLPLASNCPECGLAVTESLPNGRRRPGPWQKNELSSAGILDGIKLQLQVLCAPAFFKCVPVQRGLSSARHFWWLTFLLMAITALFLARVVDTLLKGSPHDHFQFAPFAILIGLALVPLQALMMCLTSLMAQARLGILDYRVTATVCYYASPLMWPGLILALAAAFVASDVGSNVFVPNVVVISLRNLGRIRLDELLLGGLVCAVAVAMLYWWLRVMAALRCVRFANS